MAKLVFKIQDRKATPQDKKWDITRDEVKIGEAVRSGSAWTISDLHGSRKTGMLTWCCIAIFDMTDLDEIVDQDGQALGL